MQGKSARYRRRVPEVYAIQFIGTADSAAEITELVNQHGDFFIDTETRNGIVSMVTYVMSGGVKSNPNRIFAGDFLVIMDDGRGYIAGEKEFHKSYQLIEPPKGEDHAG